MGITEDQISEMKQYIEQRMVRGLDTPELDGAQVMALITEHYRLAVKLETIRCLFGSAVPSDDQLDTAIDAVLRERVNP